MKIVLVGASGTIGRHLHAALVERHDVVAVGRTSGDVHADIASVASVRAMFRTVGEVDAIACVAGIGWFGPFANLGDAEFRVGVDSKLMGQINLVLEGRASVRDRGSFTLTSGILAADPVRNAANLSTVNGAIESFARAAAIELPRGMRINVVSPGLVVDSAAELGAYFPGHVPVTMTRVVAGYLRCIEGAATGQVVAVH